MTKMPAHIHFSNKNLLHPSSNHPPVFLSLDGLPYFKIHKTCLKNSFTNWSKFCEIIDSKINLNTSLKIPNYIEEVVYNFIESIQSDV